MFRDSVINFIMSWDRLFLARCWIAVDVMLGIVTMQKTAGSQQFANELTALQTAISFVE